MVELGTDELDGECLGGLVLCALLYGKIGFLLGEAYGLKVGDVAANDPFPGKRSIILKSPTGYRLWGRI